MILLKLATIALAAPRARPRPVRHAAAKGGSFMRSIIVLLFSIFGLIAAVTSASAQRDPFDSARSLIVSRDNEQALRIIDSGAFEIGQTNYEGWTLLHYAAEANNLEMVNALLQRGADPDAKTKWGSTPYEVASATMVKAAIARAVQARAAGSGALPQHAPPAPPQAPAAAQRAQVAARDGSNGMCAAVRAEKINDGRSPTLRPWLRARDDVWYDHPDEITLLLEDCVDANYQDGEARWTLLHHAAQRDRVEVAKILLSYGANPSIRNREGERAADLAKSPEMAALLGPKKPVRPIAGATTAREKECMAKREADAALCSDQTCRMRTLTKQQQCLQTGLYF